MLLIFSTCGEITYKRRLLLPIRDFRIIFVVDDIIIIFQGTVYSKCGHHDICGQYYIRVYSPLAEVYQTRSFRILRTCNQLNNFDSSLQLNKFLEQGI